MKTVNLFIIRGDDQWYTVDFKDKNGDPFDITGWTIYFTLKSDLDDTDANAVLKKDVTSHYDPSNGLTKIHLINTDTINLDVRNYYYDMQVKKVTGVVETVFTIIKGIFTVKQDITQRIT